MIPPEFLAYSENLEQLRDQQIELARTTLYSVREDINWMLNNRKLLNPDTFLYLDEAIRKMEETP